MLMVLKWSFVQFSPLDQLIFLFLCAKEIPIIVNTVGKCRNILTLMKKEEVLVLTKYE